MAETKMTTGVVRLSYAHVFDAHSSKPGKPAKYSTAIIIPKSDKATISKINAIVKELSEEFKAKNKGKLPPNYKLPLRDGDAEKEGEENYANAYFLNCSANNRPSIFDKKGEKIIDKDEVYSGCFAHVNINFYAFDVDGNRGIACGLNGLMKVKDGERLSGGASTIADFADIQVGGDENEYD